MLLEWASRPIVLIASVVAIPLTGFYGSSRLWPGHAHSILRMGCMFVECQINAKS